MRDLGEVEERLREWAAFYRDRRRWMRCGSAEGKFKRYAGDPDPDGWGEPAPVPQPAPRPKDWILRAIETNELVMKLNGVQRWSVTYHFCYPTLPRFIVLRAIKRFTKRHLTWKEFEDQVEIGRYKVGAMLR